MASWDNVDLARPPTPGPYGAPLADFSPLSKFGDDYFRGAQQRRTLDMQSMFANGLPKNPDGSINMDAVRATMAKFFPERGTDLANATEANQPMGPVSGGPAMQPAPMPGMPQPSGPLPAPPITNTAGTGMPARQPNVISAPDTGTSIVGMVTSKLPEDSQQTGAIIAGMAKIFRIDPNAPLNAEQQAKVAQIMQRYPTATPTAQAPAMSPAQSAAPTEAPTGGINPYAKPMAQAAPSPAPAPAAAPVSGAAAAADTLARTYGFPDAQTAMRGLTARIDRLAANPAAAARVKDWEQQRSELGALLVKPPSFGVVDVDTFGNQRHGFIDPYSQTVKPAGIEQNSAAAAANSGLTGEEFLKTLPPALASQVKAAVEGRSPPPVGAAQRNPQVQRLMQYAAQYDPGFDLVNWQARAATRKDFTAGKSAQNITSFNTAIGHLGTLDKSIDALNNTRVPIWNKVVNPIAEQLSPAYQDAIKDFHTARTAVSDELTRAFRGTGGNVHDLVQWETAINAADSPKALHTAVKQAAELLRSRIEAVGDTYNRGMGTTRDPLELLNPKAKETLETLGQKKPEAPAAVPSTKPGPDGWRDLGNGVRIREKR